VTVAAVASPNLGNMALRDHAEYLFDELVRISHDGVGITRECFAEGEIRAIELMKKAAEAEGLTTEVDAAGSLIISDPADDQSRPAIYVGSHIDSVPQGGNFDGAAGVIAGLLCMIRRRRENARGDDPVRVIILRGEESAFYARANIGSRALFGLLTTKDLDTKARGNGKTLREAMTSAGINVDPIEAGERLFDSAVARAYLEVHIEQGPVMIARELPTAIVTGIRGNIRHRKITCIGEAGHSGAVPRWLRRDAVFAASDLIARLDEHWMRLLERGLDLVITVGIVGTNPNEHAMSRIPGEVNFSFEVRSQSHDTLEAFYELFRSECRAVSDQRRVRFEFDDRIYTEPATMDPAIVKALSKASEKLGLPTELIASGAGHDAQVFANGGVPSGMIFIRNANGSHNPNEAMDIDDFLKSVDILYTAVSETL
jgi:N-carbamoyl-L-amino-acid hydrolase